MNIFSGAFSISSAQIISVIAALGVFAIVVLVSVIKDEMQNRNARIKRPENEWLFTRWDEKLYDAIMPKTPPEKVLKSLGVEIEDYVKNCKILDIQNYNFKKLAADKVIGIFMMIIGLAITAMSVMNGFAFGLIFLVFGYVVYESDVKKNKKNAQIKKKRIENELPRFLDLLQTALFIEIPVSDAIVITAKYLDNTLLSKELMESMADSQIGSSSWQESLERVAIKYEIDVFSDFVQYLITGYEKGLSIYDVVSRQCEEVRKTTTIQAEESASKLNSSILVPIAIFKLLPIIFVAMYPILIQFIGNGLF